jgi:hypothetical protein
VVFVFGFFVVFFFQKILKCIITRYMHSIKRNAHASYESIDQMTSVNYFFADVVQVMINNSVFIISMLE